MARTGNHNRATLYDMKNWGAAVSREIQVAVSRRVRRRHTAFRQNWLNFREWEEERLERGSITVAHSSSELYFYFDKH
jgi:hypothetical protein